MSFIDSREKKDVRKQFLLTASNNQKLKEEAHKLNISENELLNKLIREQLSPAEGRTNISKWDKAIDRICEGVQPTMS